MRRSQNSIHTVPGTEQKRFGPELQGNEWMMLQDAMLCLRLCERERRSISNCFSSRLDSILDQKEKNPPLSSSTEVQKRKRERKIINAKSQMKLKDEEGKQNDRECQMEVRSPHLPLHQTRDPRPGKKKQITTKTNP